MKIISMTLKWRRRIRDMQNKLIIKLLICLCISTGIQAHATNNNYLKANVSQISSDFANKLIKDQISRIVLNGLGTNKLEVYDGQYFKININKLNYYILSTTRIYHPEELTMCTVLLFDNTKRYINSVDILGPKDSRPWTCDNTEAISFLDHYQDGSLKIIALYSVTPPSNETFILPIVLKFNFHTPVLTIDNNLTNELRGKKIKTIGGARSYLKSNSAK